METRKQEESSKPGAASTGLAKQLVYTAVDAYLRHGGTFVNDEIKKERLTECSKCTEKRGEGEFKTCALCGCFLTLKAAADRYFSLSDLKFVSSSCPLNRWPQ